MGEFGEDSESQGKEEVKEVETVRCIVENNKGEVLLLQKSDDSNAPSLYEFPGGQFPHISGDSSTDEEQLKAVINELEEEAGISLENYGIIPEKFDDFSYEFDHAGKHAKRKVHLFRATIPTDGSEVIVDQTVTPSGDSEDKHQRHIWVDKSTLKKMRDEGKLSGNSQRFPETETTP